MEHAYIPPDESGRLASLHQLGLLDSPPEERFDRITRLATRLFAVPISTVTLIDRNREWFKSCQGVGAKEQDRTISFCGHAIWSAEPFVVPDTLLDPRFADNPMVSGPPGIRFYAGIGLKSTDGGQVGVLCIKDVVPRALTDAELDLLRDLAQWAQHELQAVNLANALDDRILLEDQIGLLFELSTDLICVAGADGYMRRVNPAFVRAFGYSEAECLTMPYADLVEPADHPILNAALGRLVPGPAETMTEFRCLRRDGATFPVRWSASSLGTSIYCVGRDMTAVRAQDAILHERTERLQRILDSIPVSIVLHDGTGRVEFVNHEFERTIGWNTEEAGGLDLMPILYPDPEVRARAFEFMADPNAGWGTFEMRVRSGQIRVFRWRNVRLASGPFIGIGQDLTEEKLVESKLQATERRFGALTAEAPIGIFETDHDGRCTFANRRLLEMTGVSLDQVLGFGWADCIHNDDRPAVISEWTTAVRERREFRLEFRFITPDGQVNWVEAHAVTSFGANDRPVGFIGSILDVTERHHAHDRLTKALAAAEEGFKAKSEFLAAMSHEIRTPMNGILGVADLLAESDLDLEQRQLVEIIKSSGDTLVRIVNDVLDFSRGEAGKLMVEAVPFDLTESIGDVVSLMGQKAKENGVVLTAAYPTGAPTHFIGDPTRIRQIILNLVGNAVKFTHRGRVAIAVQAHASTPGKAMVRVSVLDTGIGIPKEFQKRIFSTFSQADRSNTRRFGGSGLGLAICRQLVGLMGGTIGFESEEHRGSTFWFSVELPLVAAERPDSSTSATGGVTSSQGDRANVRVLLVDDNNVNLTVARKMLEKLGFTVETAGTGIEALEKAVDGRHAAVFMDCQMPEMDGFEATRRLRTMAYRAPIIALTANAVAGDRERCLAAGMDDYLSKPINMDRLRAVVDQWLGAGRSTST